MGENVIHSHQAPIIEVVTGIDKVAGVVKGSGKALMLRSRLQSTDSFPTVSRHSETLK